MVFVVFDASFSVLDVNLTQVPFTKSSDSSKLVYVYNFF